MKEKVLLGVGLVVIILAGIGTGVLVAKSRSIPETSAVVSTKMIKTDTEAGVTDTSTFSDMAQGTLEKGGLNGDGTHHLVLDSNPKNSAYLVSSIVDLDQFVGKHVEVWGSTQKASKVSWLMDVGRVKVLQ